MDSFNNRIYDLRDIFKNQHYVDKDFLLWCPHYLNKELDIKEGASASENWDRLFTDNLSEGEKEKIIQNLKTYCDMDAYAMYAIWKELYKLVT